MFLVDSCCIVIVGH